MRLIDADKLYPDCITKDGKLAISQSQLANASTVETEKVLVANVTFDKDKLEQIVRDRVIEPIKNGELVLQTEERPQGEWIRKDDVIHSIAEQYSEHNELVPIWLSIGDLKGGAEND